MKKVLITSLSFLMVLSFMTGCKKESSSKTKQDKNIKEVNQKQVVEGIEMVNTSMVTNDGVTTMKIKITNNTTTDYELNEYTTIMKDENGKEKRRLSGYYGGIIKSGEEKEFESTTNVDLSDVASVEYEIKEN